MKSAYQYVDPFNEMNIVYQRKEVLPNVQTFTLPTEHRRDQSD